MCVTVLVYLDTFLFCSLFFIFYFYLYIYFELPWIYFLISSCLLRKRLFSVLLCVVLPSYCWCLICMLFHCFYVQSINLVVCWLMYIRYVVLFFISFVFLAFNILFFWFYSLLLPSSALDRRQLFFFLPSLSLFYATALLFFGFFKIITCCFPSTSSYFLLSDFLFQLLFVWSLFFLIWSSLSYNLSSLSSIIAFLTSIMQPWI